MDKNSAIGFGLLMVLLIAYIFINQNNKPAPKTTKLTADTTAVAKPDSSITATDTAVAIPASASVDTPSTSAIPVSNTLIENEDVKVYFTNEGAYPTSIELKKYKTFDQKPLILFKGDKNYFDFLYSQNGQSKSTKAQRFYVDMDGGGPNSIRYSTGQNNSGFSIAYTLPEKGYMLSMVVKPQGADRNQAMSLVWNGQSLHTEQERTTEKLYTQVCYNLAKEGYDYYTIKDAKTEDFKEGIQWMSFKQHFFNTTLIPKEPLISSGQVVSSPTSDSALMTVSNFNARLNLVPKDEMHFDYFIGPNDYELLRSYDKGLEEIIPLSYGIFGFVKYINKWLVIPTFEWLSGFFSNFGIVIILLTFIIRLLMSPFTYKSYVSSAKMKALKPELDELKEQFKDDKQAYGVEQMKLYRQAGVNPLGGCLPALLQLPVFFALFSFFPHAIQMRQKGFLWATDLSTYDSIMTLPFTIPFYGNHVSLFTILFCITSLLLALYSMNTATMDQSNPMLKYMPFIMPVMFLGIFNKMPASLTLYYFVSNLITLGLQFVIQQYIIDPDKIHAKIQAKKNEPAKESKFVKKMQELQEQNIKRDQTRGQRRK